jgi:calcium-dependent protein kinase
MINPKEFMSLRKAFNLIDDDGSGTIEIEELKRTVHKYHIEMDEAELNRIIKEVDILGNGVIKYHEFIAATFPVEKYATKERIESLFQ